MQKESLNVCVIGAGYVGLVTSSCLAYFGNKVTAVESNRMRLEKLQKGIIPFFEPGVEDLVKQCTQSGSLEFTSDIEAAVKKADVIFIAVGTPSQPNGEPDLSQVSQAARSIGGALDTNHKRLIINKSTVPVGSGNWVEMLITQGIESMQAVPARGAQKSLPPFAVVSNPEFLREGTAIHDSLYPDRIVVGASDKESVDTMRLLYKPILDQSFTAPKFAPRPKDLAEVQFISTDLASAEMIKYSANAFLALKISFANEIANICEKVGADARQVMKGIGLDKRIGKLFLNAGIGWGGSCFKKDIKALIEVAHEYNSSTSLLEASISVNDRQRHIPISKLQEALKIIKGRTIGLMGLAFKPNTDDLRDAPSITIAHQLLKMGALVKAYDPVANDNCFHEHPELEIVYCHDLVELATGCDALILVTEWDEFRDADWSEIAHVMKKPIMIDGRNILSEELLTQAGFTYRGIGH